MAEALRANIDWKSAFTLRQGQFAQHFRASSVEQFADKSAADL